MPYIVSSSEVSYRGFKFKTLVVPSTFNLYTIFSPFPANCPKVSRAIDVRAPTFASILFLHSQMLLSTAKPPPLCTFGKVLRGPLCPARPADLGGEEGLQSNCVVVLLIVGAVHKCYTTAPGGP